MIGLLYFVTLVVSFILILFLIFYTKNDMGYVPALTLLGLVLAFVPVINLFVLVASIIEILTILDNVKLFDSRKK